MARCPNCNGYLIYEPEYLSPGTVEVSACGWSRYDPNFRKEEPRFFPTDSVDSRIEWQQAHPGFDLYEPKSAACQLESVEFLNYCVRHDPSAPVIMGRGVMPATLRHCRMVGWEETPRRHR